MRKPNTQAVHFPIFFKWWQIMNYLLRSSINHQVLFAQIRFHQFSKSILIMVWWAFRYGFISQWHINRMKLWKLALVSVRNDTLAINTTNFLGCLCSVLFLCSCHITCWIYTFSSSILRAWDHRLNYDKHSFTTKIKMIG